jgi:predicted lipoprotein with Yx(FWY)xxD motif
MGRMRSPTLCVALVLSLVVVASTACGGNGGAAPSVKVAFNKKLKKSILVDSQGITLYVFNADNQGAGKYKPSCYDDPAYHCSKAWPPLRTTGTLHAGAGVQASLLDTAKRTDGAAQITYNGHPLYTNAGSKPFSLTADKKPGDVNGQGFYGVWYVLSPKGQPITGY